MVGSSLQSCATGTLWTASRLHMGTVMVQMFRGIPMLNAIDESVGPAESSRQRFVVLNCLDTIRSTCNIAGSGALQQQRPNASRLRAFTTAGDTTESRKSLVLCRSMLCDMAVGALYRLGELTPGLCSPASALNTGNHASGSADGHTGASGTETGPGPPTSPEKVGSATGIPDAVVESTSGNGSREVGVVSPAGPSDDPIVDVECLNGEPSAMKASPGWSPEQTVEIVGDDDGVFASPELRPAIPLETAANPDEGSSLRWLTAAPAALRLASGLQSTKAYDLLYIQLALCGIKVFNISSCYPSFNHCVGPGASFCCKNTVCLLLDLPSTYCLQSLSPRFPSPSRIIHRG